jgi:hypothetical protein
MSSENLEHFEEHLSEAETNLGNNFYRAVEHYGAAKNIAEDKELDEIHERRLEMLREDALQVSLNEIEGTVEELEDTIYRADITRDLWQALEKTEMLAGEDGMPKKYHELKERMAESYDEIFERSVGIVNGEISVLENPEALDEDLRLAERARLASENAVVAEEMADYIGEKNPAENVYFDEEEILENLDSFALTLRDYMEIAETRAAFEHLADLTDVYGIENEEVEDGLNTKRQLNYLDIKLREIEDKQYSLENSDDVRDDLQRMEFAINEVRTDLLSSELPDEQEEKIRKRLEMVEHAADKHWAKEM